MKPIDVSDLPKHLQFAAGLTSHPIVVDDNGVYRYKANGVTNWLYENKCIDLNKVWLAYGRCMFSLEDFMQFYRDLGYSLGGFEELFAKELDRMQGIEPEEEEDEDE